MEMYVKIIESELSKLNPNTCNFKSFKKYAEIKNSLNYKLRTNYEKELFEKLKLHGFINRQKSDADMMNRFKSIFGNPADTIVLMGGLNNVNKREINKEDFQIIWI
jgi:hypothetical protein